MQDMTHVLKTVTLCICTLFLLSPPPAAGQEPTALSLEQAVATALQNNPDLEAMKERALALADMPDQEGSLADPNLALRAVNLPLDTFSLDQEPMTQLQVSLNQALPYPGKLSLRRQIAEQESRAGDFRFAMERLLLIQDVKTVWWNIYYLDRALETVERNEELYRQLNTIAQTKYEVGNGLQQDVLRAQLELSKLLDMKISLENMRHNEAIRLITLLDQKPDTPVLLPERRTENFPGVPALQELLDQALVGNPMLEDMRSMTDAARTRIELAELKFYPDFVAGATYGYRQGENADGSDRADFGTFSVTMNLPIFHRSEKNRAVSQRRHEALQQEKSLESTENAIQARVATAFSDFTKYREEIELLEGGIIPQARQTLESMHAGYQVNKVDFLSLVEAQRSLYNYETRYWKSFSSANQALARLAAAVGKEAIGE